MVKIFGYNLFGCSVCNGTKKRRFKNKGTRKRRTFRGGYVYSQGKNDSLSNSSEVVPESKTSRGKGRGKSK